jgi:hypothetical protein
MCKTLSSAFVEKSPEKVEISKYLLKKSLWKTMWKVWIKPLEVCGNPKNQAFFPCFPYCAETSFLISAISIATELSA